MKKIAVIISTLAFTSGVYAQVAGAGGAGASGGSGAGAAGSAVVGASGAGTIGQPSSVGNARIGTGNVAPSIGNPAPALGTPGAGTPTAGLGNPNPNLGNATPGGIGTPAPGIGNPVPNLPNPAAQPGVNPNLTTPGIPDPASSALGTSASSINGATPNPAADQLTPVLTPDPGLNGIKTNGLGGNITNRFARSGIGSSSPGERGSGQGGTPTNGLVPLRPEAVNPPPSGVNGASGTTGSTSGQ